MITVVNKHTHSFTLNDVYIGRGSALGNPYTGSHKIEKTKAIYQADSREHSIELYKQYLVKKIENDDPAIMDALNYIIGKAREGDVNLVCFCSPLACHGEVIKEIVEQYLEFSKKNIWEAPGSKN